MIPACDFLLIQASFYINFKKKSTIADILMAASCLKIY